METHAAEVTAPHLVHAGCIEALAAVTRRWPLEPGHGGGRSGGRSGGGNGGGGTLDVDGSLAHHYAVSALTRLCQLNRGRHRARVARSGAAVALGQRLRAMTRRADKMHSTDYAAQAAIAALESTLGLDPGVVI